MCHQIAALSKEKTVDKRRAQDLADQNIQMREMVEALKSKLLEIRHDRCDKSDCVADCFAGCGVSSLAEVSFDGASDDMNDDALSDKGSDSGEHGCDAVTVLCPFDMPKKQ
eukprot:3447125-Ditylum_brightwellii.AAC.2